MLNKKRKWVIICIVTILAISVAILAAYFLISPRSKTRAQVNGVTITQADLDKQTTFPLSQAPGIFDSNGGGAASKKDIDARNLQAAINQQLLLQEAKSRKISASAKTVTNAYNALTKSYSDPVDLSNKLKQANMTEKELKERVSDALTISALGKSLVSDASVTDAKLRAYYNSHKDLYAGAGSFNDLKNEIKADYLNDARSTAMTKLVAQLKASAKIVRN